MANCPICGSFFAPAAGKPINQQNKSIMICINCNIKKMEMLQLLGHNNSKAGDIYFSFCEKLERTCNDANMKKNILEEIQKISINKNSDFKNIIEKKHEQIELRKKIDAKNKELEDQKMEKYNNLSNNIEYILRDFLITSGYTFEGYRIKEYHGVLTGTTVLGTGIFSETAASFSDMFGIESNSFERKINQAKKSAQKKLIFYACCEEANAIIGVDYDFFTVGNNMIAVSANGTAVTVEKI